MREPENATVALKWEELQIPIRISVPNAKELWVAGLRSQLRAGVGFSWQYLQQAADWCLQNKVNLPEALQSAEKAMTPPVGGSENFSTLTTLWRAQVANGKDAEAAKTLEKALASPDATPTAIHGLGRQLQAEKNYAEADRIFFANAKRFPGKWPVNVGLMRAYAHQGNLKKALEHAKLAAAEAPDPLNKKNLEGLVKQLERGKELPAVSDAGGARPRAPPPLLRAGPSRRVSLRRIWRPTSPPPRRTSTWGSRRTSWSRRPQHVHVAADRRQGDPAQAAEPHLLPDLRGGPRGGPNRHRVPHGPGARLGSSPTTATGPSASASA